MLFYVVRFFAFLILFFAFSIPANAQIVNIEQGRIGRDTTKNITGKIGMAFTLFNQNAGKNQPNNYLQLNFNGDIGYNSTQHSYMLFNFFNYLLVNYTDIGQRNTISRQGYSHLRANFYRDRRFSYEVFTQGQFQKARGLEWRSLAGGYLRFRLMRNYKNVNLYLGTGLMHEHEEWRNPGIENELVVANMVKTTNYISAKMKFAENLESNAIVYYQTGYAKEIDNFRNRISGDINLSIKFNKAVAFRTNFNCTFEDEPVVPVTRFVYAIQNGVTVAF